MLATPTTHEPHFHILPHKSTCTFVYSTLHSLPLCLPNCSFKLCVPDLNLNNSLVPSSQNPYKEFTLLSNLLYMCNIQSLPKCVTFISLTHSSIHATSYLRRTISLLNIIQQLLYLTITPQIYHYILLPHIVLCLPPNLIKQLPRVPIYIYMYIHVSPFIVYNI